MAKSHITYRVIASTELGDFQTEVEHYINDGWKLLGGLCITLNPPTQKILFAQAITTKTKVVVKEM